MKKKLKKILFVFGTRPEAIKLAPVIFAFKRNPSKFKVVICVTAQHRKMLDQALKLFNIVPDYDMNVMSKSQDLFDITENALKGLKKIILKERPNIVLAQGDTTTAFVSSLAAFYCKVPVGHIEAGLRSNEKYQPFPEEKNRQMISVLADYHFVPTESARKNLIKENISEKDIWVTGNTVIDALSIIAEKQKNESVKKNLEEYFEKKWNLRFDESDPKIILVTGHRRENFGNGFKNICAALKKISQNNPDCRIIYPVHLNPNVRVPVFGALSVGKTNRKNIYLIDPLEYDPFIYLMSKSYFILTDSGGIQEEAITLKKPLLIMRAVTERPEGVVAGAAKLVGTDAKKIVFETQKLLDNEKEYQKMILAKNPYGDGEASLRIKTVVESFWSNNL